MAGEHLSGSGIARTSRRCPHGPHQSGDQGRMESQQRQAVDGRLDSIRRCSRAGSVGLVDPQTIAAASARSAAFAVARLRSTPEAPAAADVVPESRFELERDCSQRSLSPPRLPVPPLRPGQHRSGRAPPGAWHAARVYVPDHFRPSDDEVRALLDHLDAADLITPTADGLLATFLPLLFEPPGASVEAGPLGRLLGHVARNNRQWKTPPTGEA